MRFVTSLRVFRTTGTPVPVRRRVTKARIADGMLSEVSLAWPLFAKLHQPTGCAQPVQVVGQPSQRVVTRNPVVRGKRSRLRQQTLADRKPHYAGQAT